MATQLTSTPRIKRKRAQDPESSAEIDPKRVADMDTPPSSPQSEAPVTTEAPEAESPEYTAEKIFVIDPINDAPLNSPHVEPRAETPDHHYLHQQTPPPFDLNESSVNSADLDLNMSPVEPEGDLSKPPRTPELKTKTKPQVVRAENEPRPESAAAIWLFFTIQVIGISLQKQKMKDLATAIAKSVNDIADRTMQIREIGARTIVAKIRADMVAKAKAYSPSTGELVFRPKETYKSKKAPNARGMINVPSSQNFATFEKDLKSKNAEIESIRQNFEYKNNEKVPTQTASVIFKGDEAPIQLKGLIDLVKPVFLAVIRCQKCQMFGHRANNCKNEAKCPHCAGNHTHNQCFNRRNKKCANCQGPHSAAYRGCTYFLAYQQKINGNNAAIETSFMGKCASKGVETPVISKPQPPRPPKPTKAATPEMTHKEITALAAKLEHKPAAEIIQILRQELTIRQEPKPATAPTQAAHTPVTAEAPKATTTTQSEKQNAPPRNEYTARHHYRPVPHYRPNGPPRQGPHMQYAPPSRRPVWATHNIGPQGPMPLISMQCRPPPHYGRAPYGGPYTPRHQY